MTTLTPSPTTDTNAQSQNEQLWHRASAFLYEARVDEYLDCWHESGRYEVAYPIGEFPASVSGKPAIGELFAGFGAAAESISVEGVRFHQTTDPDVAFVEETMTAELRGGGTYVNRLAMRVTFRDGLIAEVFEYYGEQAHEGLLRRLGLVA